MLTEEKKKGEKNETKSEMSLEEYYIKKHCNSVQESLALFKDDPLVHKPGETATVFEYVCSIVASIYNYVYITHCIEYYFGT